ncbi:MAG: MG2 domain-containing protein [Bacteroidia bacterium]|nr:MG2 domain-containing protein [Bacteroidia bacterium]MDW8089742.1 MG2 domain-containing protein [Bacteroidia bacterium]
MRRKYGLTYILGGLVVGAAIVGSFFWVSSQRKDFQVALPPTGLPPGVQAIVVHFRQPLAEKIPLSFKLEPYVPILSCERLGKQAALLITGAPLQAGQTYTLKALRPSPLRGQVRFRVAPLEIVADTLPHVGPAGEAAIYIQANAPIKQLDLNRLHLTLTDGAGRRVPIEWVAVSERAALGLLPSSPSGFLHLASYTSKTERIRGATLNFSETHKSALYLRESVWEEPQRRIRLRFNRWIEPYRQQIRSFLRLPSTPAFQVWVNGLELYLFPQEIPREPIRIELAAGFPDGGPQLAKPLSLVITPTFSRRLEWLQPYVHFLTPGTPLYFTAPSGAKQVEHTIWRIAPQNVRFFLRQQAEALYANYPSPEQLSSQWYGWGGPQFGDLDMYGEVLRRGRLPLSALPKRQQGGQLWYGLGYDLPPGLYALQIQLPSEEGGDFYDRQISTWVVVSDYLLLARKGAEELSVWAIRSNTGKPCSGARIEVWGPSGEILARGTTDQAGKAVLRVPPSAEVEGIGSLWEGQLNYLTLRALRPYRWSFETEGLSAQASGPLIYLQPGRTLYVPGDTITLAGLTRLRPDLSYAKEMTFEGLLSDPEGRELWRGPLKTDKQGFWTWRYRLSPNAPTGTYTWQVFASGEPTSTPLNSLSLQVEFFRPPRLHIQMALEHQRQTAKLNLQAVFWHGAPAGGLEGELSLRWKPLSLSGPAWQDYIWDINIPRSALDSFSTSIPFTLGPQGTFSTALPLPKGWGYGELLVTAILRDDEGRPNLATRRLVRLTQPVLVGMKKLPPWIFVGTPTPLPLRLLTTDSLQPYTAPISLHVEVIHRGYWYGYYRAYHEEHAYEGQEKVIYRGLIPTQKGEGLFNFIPPEGGEYEIRIWAPEQRFPTVQRVEAWGMGALASLRGDPEGFIQIVPQQPTYAPGQKAKALLKLPFPGRVLLTLEREKVWDSWWVEAREPTVNVEFTVKAAYAPGLYLHAVAFYEPGWGVPFRTGRGLIYLPIEPPRSRLPVTIQAPTEVLSGTSLTVEVQTAPYAQVLLSGLDMGLAVLQRQEVGNPHDFFYQKRAHELVVAEQLPYTAPWGPHTIGGGEEASSSEEMVIAGAASEQGRAAKSYTYPRTVSFYWPALKADGQGRVRITAQLPFSFTGKLRWRAYAATERQFGMGESFTTVSQPVVARLSLPPYLSLGDRISASLSLHNTTAEPKEGTWKIVLPSQAFRLTPSEGRYKLMPHSLAILPLSLEGLVPIGEAKAQLYLDNRLVQEVPLNLRPAQPLQHQWVAYRLGPKQEEILRLPTADHFPATRKTRLVVGTSPLIFYAPALRQLATFPHGCGEQITSKALVALVVGQWLEILSGYNEAQIAQMVRASLSMLREVMTPEGGFAYWPGGSADPWLSVYITHFLLLAAQAGYAEAKPLLEKALAYQKNLLYSQTYDYASHTAAYRAFVVAQAYGKEIAEALPALSQMARVISPVQRALWRAAYAQAELPLPPPSSAKPKTEPFVYEELISPWRDEALWIYAESFVPASKRALPSESVQRLQSELADRLVQRYFYSTQETAWLLLALQRISPSGKAVQAEVRLASKTFKLNTSPVGINIRAESDSVIHLANLGGDSLYALIWSEGIPIKPQPPQTSGFRLQTSWETPAYPNLQPGQSVKWHVDIQTDYAPLPLYQVALTIPIPSGWEVLNPRLFPEEAPIHLEGADLVYVDSREDQLRCYLTLRKPKVRLSLRAQVTYGGTYVMPALSILAMYNPNLYGTTPVVPLQVPSVKASP